MYQVYLAGIIGNSTYKQATEWREYVTRQCTRLYGTEVVCKSPMRFKEHLDASEETLDFVYQEQLLSSAKAIVSRDLNDVRNSDLVLAKLDTEIISIGTSMEIAIAAELRIPIIGVFSKDANNIYNKHPFIQELVNFKTDDLDTAIALIGKVL